VGALPAILNLLLPLGYLAVFIDYGVTFFRRVRERERRPWLGIVLLVHAAFLVVLGLHLGRLPLVTNFEILSVVALATGAVYWLIERTTHERRTGVIVLLLVFLFQYVSTVFVSHPAMHPPPVPAESSLWLRLHVVPAVLAYTSLSVCAVYGVLYLLARRVLKRRSFGLLYDRLPPLELLGKMAWNALLIGFVFLTIVVVTGPAMMRWAEGPGSAGLDAKVIAKIALGTVAWLLYAVAIGGRLLARWPVARSTGIALNGFVVIMALLLVSAALS
jgi:ABC-type uncharacterized transport system permease subunit